MKDRMKNRHPAEAGKTETALVCSALLSGCLTFSKAHRVKVPFIEEKPAHVIDKLVQTRIASLKGVFVKAQFSLTYFAPFHWSIEVDWW